MPCISPTVPLTLLKTANLGTLYQRINVLRKLKKRFHCQIVDLISFVNGKIKKYVTVGKIISSSFKRAQPEVSSFIRLGDTLS